MMRPPFYGSGAVASTGPSNHYVCLALCCGTVGLAGGRGGLCGSGCLLAFPFGSWHNVAGCPALKQLEQACSNLHAELPQYPRLNRWQELLSLKAYA